MHGWDVSGIGPERIAGQANHLDSDISDRETIAEWLDEVRPTHLIHLAALSHVVGEPIEFYKTNLLGTEALVEAAAQASPHLERLIIASSANVYGNAMTNPIAESALIRPVNHYALSKAAVELLARKWTDRLPITIVRPFNYTGVGQSERFVFAKLAAAFRRGDARISLGNIDIARDLADVGFVCEAYRRLLDFPGSGHIFNICTGTPTSLRDAIAALSALTDHHPEIDVDQSLIRIDDIKLLVGNPDRLFQAIGQIRPLTRDELFLSMLSTD